MISQKRYSMHTSWTKERSENFPMIPAQSHGIDYCIMSTQENTNIIYFEIRQLMLSRGEISTDKNSPQQIFHWLQHIILT